MNGQTARLEATRQIIHRCSIRQIVETGTFRGTTTEWFASFGLPVTTIEANPRDFHFAKLRLNGWRNVRVELGNSVVFLRSFITQTDTSRPTFFYLDAHWAEYLPLREEMRIILDAFAAPVILIDDFKVPGQPGYEYDDYGPDKILEIEYLREFLSRGIKVFYPSTPAEEETGRRRGWAVMTSHAGMASILDGLQPALLQQFN